MITVGLDFGTHQTKVCIEEKEGAVLNYSFMKFHEEPAKDNNLGLFSRLFLKGTKETRKKEMFYTFPSIIGIDKNGLLSYGFLPKDFDGTIIKYFKQRLFLANTHETDKGAMYYSIWYLTYILFDLEKDYDQNFSIQMGVPSDADENNLSKAKEIATRVIASAYRLVEKEFCNNKQKFLSTPIDKLREITEIIPYSKEILEEYQLRVFPEAYACLRPLASQGKIDKHMNLMIDIGGGTTDISFFTIEEDEPSRFETNIGEPNVYWFYSLKKGLNYLTGSDDKTQKGNIINVQDASEIVAEKKDDFFREVENVIDDLHAKLREVWNKDREIINIPYKRFLNELKDRPLVYCGGGSTFQTLLRSYKGFQDITLISHREWNTRSVNDLDEIIEKNLSPILSTAYGLAISSVDDKIKMQPLRDLLEELRDEIKEDKSSTDDFDYGLDYDAYK